MKSCRCVFASLAGLTLSATFAGAAGVPVGHIQLADSYGSTNGGEFRGIAQPDFTFIPGSTGTAFQGSIAPASNLFETFCVEKNEQISFGTTYAASLNTETDATNVAYAGGAHGGYNDPLDAMTAYLYTNFINHTLVTSYDYGSGSARVSDANALQTAIWFIEQEDSTALTGKALTLYNEADNAVNVNHTWTGIGDVRILNLTTAAGASSQDQLVMVSSIPLPGAASMAGLGLLGLVARRRRK